MVVRILRALPQHLVHRKEVMCREVSSSSPVWPAEVWSSPPGSSWSAFENWFQDVKCESPHVTGESAFPCGKCASCLAHRRKVWTHRIMLEAAQWENNAFCTLTYSDDKVPFSLEPMDLTLFLKRLRARWITPIRYYAVGEYSPTMRPHFHLAVFNFPTCQCTWLRTGDCRCAPCSAVREAWTFGHILLGSLEERSAAYIAGYVLKKMNSRKPTLSSGQIPEFARMSLRPGIGAGAMWDAASVLMTYPKIVKRQGDVASALRHGTRVLPLGPYLKRLLRRRIGLDEAAPQWQLEAAKERLRLVFDYAKCNAPASVRREVVKALIGEFNEQHNRNVAARSIRKGSIQ